jgi:hypothetical protein
MAEPDLTAELDTAEDIVMGRIEAVEIEWGVRYGDEGYVGIHGTGPDRERHARLEADSEPGTLVRRTVTYGPWEDVPRA